jgi:outer membrane lipoprotein-sorting protein
MRHQRIGLVVIAWACAVMLLAGAPPDLFDTIYARGRPIATGLKTLTARFTETSTSSLLAKPLVASGTLVVERPSRVVLRYAAPEPRTILIDGDVMRVVWPSRAIDQQTAIGASQRRIQQYFVDQTPGRLRSHFDSAARVPGDRPSTWHVTMVPRRRQIREGLTKLDLWVDQTTVLLAAMQMTFATGDTKLLEFSDVKINPPIDPSVFTP